MALFRFFSMGLLLGSLITACDNSGSHSRTGTDRAPTTVSGNVVKGVMATGEVSLYNIVNGGKGSLIASTTSADDGAFNFSIPSGENGPFVIEATSAESTRLRCDVWEGCGNTNAGSPDDQNQDGQTNFGEYYSAPSLTLSAIAADSSAINRLSVTPLTHLATRYAASFPQGWDSLSITLAHSQLSNLFGFETDLSGLKAFDITQAAPTTATLDQWHYSLLNAAFAALADGGAASPDLGLWLDSAADTFALQNGQLLARNDNSGTLSAEALANYARLLAVHLNSGADPFFARLLLQLSRFEVGQLTQAQSTSGIGNAAFDKVITFLDDWRTWRDELPLYGDGTPFATSTQPRYQEYLQAQWTLTQVLASASQYAPYAAAPDLVLTQACEALTNIFYKALCTTLINNKTICLFGLAINGEPLCSYLTHLNLPLTNGLTATVDIFAHTAQLSGTLNGQEINLSMVTEQTSTQQITMHLTGDITGERYAWSVMDGTSTFDYDAPLSVTNFQLPDRLSSDISLTYSASDANTVTLAGQLQAKFKVELDPWRAIAWSDDLATALSQVPMTLEMSGNFSVPYSGTGYLYIKGGEQTWLEAELPQQSPYNGLLAQIRLAGDVSQWQTGLLDSTTAWNGHTLVANYANDRLEMQNGSGIKLVMPELNTISGNLYFGNQRYARLYLQDGVWQVQLADNSEETL